jgi:two-component system KDP operon response regulator KdpE
VTLRVVVAEDEWVVAEQIRLELMGLGYEVVASARTGTEALDACLQQHPDLILIDLKMPDMDGVVAIARIMSSCPVPIIVVTGQPELAEQAEEAGAVGYLEKPFSSEAFLAAARVARERFAHLMEQA